MVMGSCKVEDVFHLDLIVMGTFQGQMSWPILCVCSDLFLTDHVKVM